MIMRMKILTFPHWKPHPNWQHWGEGTWAWSKSFFIQHLGGEGFPRFAIFWISECYA
jgi:hypothetical protein